MYGYTRAISSVILKFVAANKVSLATKESQLRRRKGLFFLPLHRFYRKVFRIFFCFINSRCYVETSYDEYSRFKLTPFVSFPTLFAIYAMSFISRHAGPRAFFLSAFYAHFFMHVMLAPYYFNLVNVSDI